MRLLFLEGSMTPISVLKFGSSVVRTPKDLPHAVHEIFRELRVARSVVAVVSAFAGVTKRLYQEALEIDPERDPCRLATHVAEGVRQTTRALEELLDRVGVPAVTCQPRAIGLRALGEPLDGEPNALNTDVLTSLIARPAVLIVPSLIALDSRDRTLLLGRGGSDLTALFIAQRLGAYCRLIKAADGIYERVLSSSDDKPRRFHNVRLSEALHVAARLVHPRAIRFAQRHGLEFDIAAIGVSRYTRVGLAASRFAAPAPAGRRLRVILLGLGAVGGGVYRCLSQRPDLFDVRRVLVRDIRKARDTVVDSSLLSCRLTDVVNEPADLVIEAMSGLEPASAIVLSALHHGRTVITANKLVVAEHWEQLSRFARGFPRHLRFSAAVEGAAPVLGAMAALGNSECVTRLRVVFNGVRNLPVDAGCRLRILARTAFGHELSAERLSCENAARAELLTNRGRCLQLKGKDAGRWPTALAVMGDVYAHLRDIECSANAAIV
jgi:homoserine dehydrogenase